MRRIMLAISTLCILAGCEDKDYCQYNQDACQPDQPQLGCTTPQDCDALPNTQAQCTSEGQCLYTCAAGWADTTGNLQTEGCLCDSTQSSCSSMSSCGDGFKEGPEACDDGPLNDDTTPDACRTSCALPRCGDGVKDTGEQCDDGNIDNTDDCTAACTMCGNGRLDPGEACDDGQTPGRAGDGCSETCQIETQWGFRCTETTPSECWQEILPPEGAGLAGLVSSNVTINDEHLFADWRFDDGKILYYAKDDRGVWTKQGEIIPGHNEPTYRLTTFQNDLIQQTPHNVYIYKKSNNTYTQQPPPIFSTADQINEISIYENTIYIQTYSPTERKIHVLKGTNHTPLPAINTTINDTLIDSNQNIILLQSTQCQNASTCAKFININTPNNIIELPQPDGSKHVAASVTYKDHIIAFNEQGILIYKTSTPQIAPAVITFLRTKPAGEEYLTTHVEDDKLWLTHSIGKDSSTKQLNTEELSLENTQTFPLSFGANAYINIQRLDQNQLIVTDTASYYTSSPISGGIFIFPNKK